MGVMRAEIPVAASGDSPDPCCFSLAQAVAAGCLGLFSPPKQVVKWPGLFPCLLPRKASS